jgi:hypothetical protein
MWESNRLWRLALEISTLLGGLAALFFFYGKIKYLQVKFRRHSPNAYPKRVVVWSGIYSLVFSIAFSFLSYHFGVIQAWACGLSTLLPMIPIAYFSPKIPKSRYQDLLNPAPKYKTDLYAIFAAGASFAFCGGYLAVLFGWLVCFLTGDTFLILDEHYPGSLSSILAGLFCFLEAIVYALFFAPWEMEE